MFTKFAAIGAVLSLCACGIQAVPLEQGGLQSVALNPAIEDAARIAVGKNLKDPYSARLEGLTAFRKDTYTIVVCGAVNAKNSYGGYVGSVPFIAYVSLGVGEKTGQYFPIIATVSGPESGSINYFFSTHPVCPR
jgi:hypothetical protein